MLAGMERSEAIAALPDPYQRLLRLLDTGADPATIAAELDVDAAGLPALVELAHAKLAARLGRPDPRGRALPGLPSSPGAPDRAPVAVAAGRTTTAGGGR